MLIYFGCWHVWKLAVADFSGDHSSPLMKEHCGPLKRRQQSQFSHGTSNQR
jgi:hypothetical protein